MSAYKHVVERLRPAFVQGPILEVSRRPENKATRTTMSIANLGEAMPLPDMRKQGTGLLLIP
jgi:hypothetical protein